MASACHGVAEPSVHHPGLYGKVDYRLLLPIIYARELCLVGFLLYHLHLFYDLRRDILGRKLGVVKEELLAIDHHLGDCLAIGGNGAIRIHLHSRKFFQQFLQHVIVRSLEQGCGVLDSILLDNHLVADCSDARGIEHLHILIHLHGTEIDRLALHIQHPGVRLVPHHFRFEKEYSVPYSEDGNLAISCAHGELVCPGSRSISQGNRRKAYRLSCRGIGKGHLHRHPSLGMDIDTEKECAGHNKHTKDRHNRFFTHNSRSRFRILHKKALCRKAEKHGQLDKYHAEQFNPGSNFLSEFSAGICITV